MPDVTFSVAGRAYRLRCAVGQEEQLRQTAAALDERVTPLVKLAPAADDRQLLVIAALELLDELNLLQAEQKAETPDWAEAAARLNQLQAENAGMRAWAGKVSARLELLADSLDVIATEEADAEHEPEPEIQPEPEAHSKFSPTE